MQTLIPYAGSGSPAVVLQQPDADVWSVVPSSFRSDRATLCACTPLTITPVGWHGRHDQTGNALARLTTMTNLTALDASGTLFDKADAAPGSPLSCLGPYAQLTALRISNCRCVLCFALVVRFLAGLIICLPVPRLSHSFGLRVKHLLHALLWATALYGRCTHSAPYGAPYGLVFKIPLIEISKVSKIQTQGLCAADAADSRDIRQQLMLAARVGIC